MTLKKVLSNYIQSYLSKPNPRFYNNSMPCPFAIKALQDDKIKIVEIEDSNEFWQNVVNECRNFTGRYEVVVVACKNSVMSLESLLGGCDALNVLFANSSNDLWLLGSENFASAMVLIQPLSKLDDASKILEKNGYYKLYDKKAFETHIVKRRKIRETFVNNT